MPIFSLKNMQNEELAELITPAVEAVGFQLWGVEYNSDGHKGLLRVYIDSENGINVDDCANASYQISGMLDVHDPIREEYTLEVSSPGLNRPLFTLEQFTASVGSDVRMRLHHAINGKRRFRGTITAVDGDDITITAMDGDAVKLTMADISKANIMFAFEGENNHGE